MHRNLSITIFTISVLLKTLPFRQKIENPDELWCLETDKRWKYDLSADELVDIVAKNEAEGQNIIIWAAHGSAVFFPLSTFKRLLEAAPKHLIGFVFAEMEGTDRHMQDVVAKLLFTHCRIVQGT